MKQLDYHGGVIILDWPTCSISDKYWYDFVKRYFVALIATNWKNSNGTIAASPADYWKN
jgi:hypothetical protein